MIPMRTGTTRWLPVASLAALAVAVLSCSPNVAERADRPPAGAPPPARVVSTARPQPATREISFPSSLYVERDVEVAARSSGVIMEVLVDRGARVKAGDPMALMETEIARHELEIAGQEARLAQAEFDRIVPLHQKKVVSDSDYVEAEIARDQAISRRELARAYLELCTVRAPFDGTVVERWAVEGKRIQEEDGVALFRVMAHEPMRARVDIPEGEIDSLGKNSPAFVETLDGDETHTARVVFVSPAIDAASGTVPVIIQMVGRNGHLRPGSAVRVRFQEDHGADSATVRIPRSALADVAVHENEMTTVLVVVEGRATTRKVRVLETGASSVLVAGRISADDELILETGAPIREGEIVAGQESLR